MTKREREKLLRAISLIHSDDGDYHAGMALLCEMAGLDLTDHRKMEGVRAIDIREALIAPCQEFGVRSSRETQG